MAVVNERCRYELECRYSPRKSFYGKANVVMYEDGSSALISYSTVVACVTIEDGKKVAHHRGQYSMTTSTHQKEYLKQEGFWADNTKQMIKDYGDTEENPFDWKNFMLERGLR